MQITTNNRQVVHQEREFQLSSIAETKALAKFAKLPFNIVGTQSFAPLLPSSYRDGAGVELTGKPDAICTQACCFTFLEIKDGVLNDHPDKASSHQALQAEYTHRTYDLRDKPYNELTAYFARVDPVFLHAHAFNQSLFKVLALQQQFGFERYLVVFANNPREPDARRYAEAGLVYCTNATLEQMLAVIDLAAHGLYFPFILDAYRSGYNVVVNPMPNPAYAGFTSEQIAAASRAEYEAVVATYKAREVDYSPF